MNKESPAPLICLRTSRHCLFEVLSLKMRLQKFKGTCCSLLIKFKSKTLFLCRKCLEDESKQKLKNKSIDSWLNNLAQYKSKKPRRAKKKALEPALFIYRMISWRRRGLILQRLHLTSLDNIDETGAVRWQKEEWQALRDVRRG